MRGVHTKYGLHCHPCRAKMDDQLATDFQNIAQYIDHTMTNGSSIEVGCENDL